MNRYPDARPIDLYLLAAHAADHHWPSEYRAGRRAAQRHDGPWAHELALVVDPPAAGFDLASVRFLVKPAFAARLMLEVLHSIGEIDGTTVDAGSCQCAVEDAAGGADEGAAGQILLVPGLFADEHHLSVGWTLAEHGLGSVAPERAPAAAGRLAAQGSENVGNVAVHCARVTRKRAVRSFSAVENAP